MGWHEGWDGETCGLASEVGCVGRYACGPLSKCGPAVSHMLKQMVPKLVWSDNGCTSTLRVADER